ncbi:rod shape-determining protein MreC [Aquirufa nivalisilvae]|uniref:Cell shape-determining protein MreC n=1 Tax=Aquirufa nivalisilvae TaxID=2516557 RepID=A0A2S2DXR6_9BACT|nr:rod shape-determining protein MreC [Aquirufa nivalisilvae]AWL10204.1 hypothetical protein HME7025_02363 [Aquirufa nivalisilvae]MCZ2479900.1 rod shape-determining protein MreC [Aquirufa nivalisilvae]MCZ2481894.1 rod shape-determining protein MreC [Aquirufa nivalisilvae]TBH76037.1 rod shape-determining protein MreC [Aquirufa nivalisilvae]
MNQLFQFLLRQRNFLLFFVLELISLWSVFKYNDYQRTLYFNTTNQWVASLLAQKQEVQNYYQLRDINRELASENAQLRQEVFRLKAQKAPDLKLPYYINEAVLNRYQPVACKVIDLTTQQSQNYLTIDKGTKDGLHPGMAVISSTGVVGKVLSCTENLSMVISILHINNTVSAKLKSSGELGYVKWAGWQPEVAEMMDVSKYKKVVKGDTVVTSDYNAVFPPNVPIGIVAKLGLKKDGNFHDIKIMLLTHFSTLQYVYVIKNRLAWQQAKLEQSKPKPE